MSIKIVLYGDLKPNDERAANRGSKPLLINIKNSGINIIYDIFEKLGIKEDEISHIFVNHKYCGPGIELKEGDRVALFPRRMAIMFEEILHSNSIEITVKFSNKLRKNQQKVYLVNVPIGSNIINVLKKFNVNFSNDNLKVLVNEFPCNDPRCILHENDVVRIASSSVLT
ncbi:MAG: MoaD/ThiS family protein [Promethearchaeota archaeon]